ncbi:rhamnulokinase family protein [Acidobacterium sp. S8]|uniref:rhamnulokinase n=1 Tax=Acidobacterium sp. S8 TaxID=1641854 RepID=UPI00131DC5E5|nr:FGGY-family carbohydrate kinase [Acidobacterium sp. S8]
MPGSDFPNLIAIDLGAESCRVSLLRWLGEKPEITLVHRFGNAPVANQTSLHWNFQRILSELEKGLTRCADECVDPIASIGVDGWAVDYVRLDENNEPISEPYCYRDARTETTFSDLHSRYPNLEMFMHSGIQPLRINTMYQLMADSKAGINQGAPWMNLPEYVLSGFGGRLVSEYTNATHTGLIDMRCGHWSEEIFDRAELSLASAPELVATGTDIGQVHGRDNHQETYGDTRLIAVACHDTASAVSAIPIEGDDWAYISSGTWSLLGMVLGAPVITPEAFAAGFTNLGAAGNRICFHKNVNGMWLLKQTLLQLCPEPHTWSMPALIEAAEAEPHPGQLLDVDDPDLWLPGSMASRINAQRALKGVAPLPETAAAMPRFASLIFHSLAARYAETLRDAEQLTGRKLKRLAIVGGGNQNQFLNRLTAEATGLEITCGAAESSTIGNFAVQLATLEGKANSPSRLTHWARTLTSLH